MLGYKKKLFIILLLGSFLVSCNTPQQDIPILIEIPSLSESYAQLLERAQQWQPNAYLADATINFFPEAGPHAIDAGFYSQSQDENSLGVYLSWDGTISTKTFFYPHSVYHHTPILPNDWTIDSKDVFDFVSDENARRLLANNQAMCTRVTLERFLVLEKEPLVWALGVSDCDKYKELFYIDPNTGEILENARDIKPTRIPTQKHETD